MICAPLTAISEAKACRLFDVLLADGQARQARRTSHARDAAATLARFR